MKVGRIARWIVLVVVIASAAGVLSLFGVAMGAIRGSLVTAVLSRSMIALFMLIVLMAWAVAKWRHDGPAFFLGAAATAYVLQPYAFTGQVLIGQFISGNPWVRMTIDWAIWMAVAAVVFWRQLGRHPREAEPLDLGVLR